MVKRVWDVLVSEPSTVILQTTCATCYRVLREQVAVLQHTAPGVAVGGPDAATLALRKRIARSA